MDEPMTPPVDPMSEEEEETETEGEEEEETPAGDDAVM